VASRHPRSTSIGEYTAFHVNSVATLQVLPTTPSAVYSVLDQGHGVFLGCVTVNNAGTNCVLLLYNGATLIASIKPTANVTLEFNAVLDAGLLYTYSGSTLGSTTLGVLPVPV
jgi:hypothetical protein